MYGSFVRAARQARRMSQRQLAEVSGVQQANVSAIENERRVPSAETLNRLLVSCGFELAAVAGKRVIYCDLPKAGWFPDEDLPPRTAADPPDEPPALGPGTTMEERVRVITAVLEAANATPTRR